MKNWDQCRIEKLNFITVVWVPQIESVKLMVQEHYDIPDYEDTLFLINTLGKPFWLNKEDFPQHRKIYYNLEHTNDLQIEDKNFVNNWFKDFGITEVWSFEPNSEIHDSDLGVKYMPMRYTSYIKKQPYLKTHKFDLGFIGVIGSSSLNPRRNNFFDSYIRKGYDFSLKIMNGYTISDLQDELASCRFMLDTHRNYRHTMQNQVRLFEHVCLGHTVLSEKSEYNIFPGLIYEWENIDELNNLVKTVEPQDFSEKYKEMTYTDDAYDYYRYNIILHNYTQKMHNYYNSCGIYSYDIINKLITKFNYKHYLEIGVYNGENYNKINCEQKTSVDINQYGATKFLMDSDEYFNSITEQAKFDIIFIDGLHLWEQCYRDINNALSHLSPNGVIICHDMNPIEEMYQSRNQITGVNGDWNGDVWKAFVKVRTERHDIHACMIEDCDCGLGIITFGTQEPLVLDKPFEELSYTVDFAQNKSYLMNTVKVNDFIERNNL